MKNLKEKAALAALPAMLVAHNDLRQAVKKALLVAEILVDELERGGDGEDDE